MAEEYSIVYMYQSFLIHSSADGHLGCFHVLAIINSAEMNISVHVSLSVLVSSVCMPTTVCTALCSCGVRTYISFGAFFLSPLPSEFPQRFLKQSLGLVAALAVGLVTTQGLVGGEVRGRGWPAILGLEASFLSSLSWVFSFPQAEYHQVRIWQSSVPRRQALLRRTEHSGHILKCSFLSTIPVRSSRGFFSDIYSEAWQSLGGKTHKSISSKQWALFNNVSLKKISAENYEVSS